MKPGLLPLETHELPLPAFYTLGGRGLQGTMSLVQSQRVKHENLLCARHHARHIITPHGCGMSECAFYTSLRMPDSCFPQRSSFDVVNIQQFVIAANLSLNG